MQPAATSGKMKPMHVDISIEEYARARAEFRKFDETNFLIRTRHVTIALIVSVLVYLVFFKLWILIIAGLLLVDLTRKTGIREGYIYGFELGMERGYLKACGPTPDDRGATSADEN